MKIYGIFKDDEWQKPYGYGPKPTMRSMLKMLEDNSGLEVKKIKDEASIMPSNLSVFAETIDKFGITCYRISKETGVNASTIGNWRNGNFRPNPYDDNYVKVIDYIKEKTGIQLSLLDFVKKNQK